PCPARLSLAQLQRILKRLFLDDDNTRLLLVTLLQKATGAELQALRRALGGSYALTLSAAAPSAPRSGRAGQPSASAYNPPCAPAAGPRGRRRHRTLGHHVVGTKVQNPASGWRRRRPHLRGRDRHLFPHQRVGHEWPRKERPHKGEGARSRG